MSDTVKLIIEIPKEAKQAFDNAESNDLKGGYYDHGGIIGKAIQNGIPLDDVKAEIEKQIERDFAFVETETLKVPCHYGIANGLQNAIRFLDNMSKESEVKPNEHSTNLCISDNAVL